MPDFLSYEIRVKTKDVATFEPFYISNTPLPEYKLIDPVLNLEESAAGSLEFKMPPNNVYYDKITMMSTTIRVYCNNEEIWEGRPLKSEENMWKNHKVTCEGALAYLNDVYQPQALYGSSDGSTTVTFESFLKAVIDIYNAKAPVSRRFELGSVNTSLNGGSGYGVFKTSYEPTLSVLNSFCETYDCYMYTERNPNTGLLKINFGDASSRNGVNDTQTIEFGKNLTDYARNFDFSNLVSAVLPLGAKIEKNDQANVRGEKLNATAVYTGHIIANPVTEGTSPDNPLLSVEDENYRVYTYTINPGDNVFITSQMNNAHGMWCVKDSSGNFYYNIKYANNRETFTIADGTRLTIVSSGYIDPGSTLYVGCYVDPTFKAFSVYSGLSSEEVDELDEYTNISDLEERDDVKDATGDHIAWIYTDKGSLYVVNEEALNEYGWIERKLEFSNEENPAVLYIKARQYLTSDRFDGMEIKVTAFDLRAFGIDSATQLKVGQRINVIAKPYSLDTYMPITKLQIPLDKPDGMTYTLGSTSNRSLTASNSSTNSDLLKRIAEAPAMSSVISSTKKNVVAKIKDCNSSYVTIKYANGTDKAEAIIISDTPNYQQSTKGYWIWNAAGLAFIDGNGDPHNAMTDDGQMYADIITTGTMAADRILGGTLKLGHWNNTDGELQMKDNSGNVILSVDKSNGIISEDPSNHYKAIVRGGEVRFLNPNDASGSFNFAPGIANQVFADGQGNPLYRCLSLYGQRIGFNCNNFWVFSNGSWYATDEGVRTITLDGKQLTFVNGILKEVENV